MLMIVGMPRSGTTWLGRIVDTHPDVLYRHEPDQTVSADGLPNFPEGDEYASCREATAVYLKRLSHESNLHVSGHRHLYPKRYWSRRQNLCRQGTIYAWHLLQKALGSPRWTDRLAVPDFGADRYRAVRIAIKTVVSNGRARLFSEADPNLRIVLIVRHPCGYLASYVRGQEAGKLGSGSIPADTLGRTREARKYGLTATGLKELSSDEQKIWYWIIVNDRIMTDMAASDRFLLLRYEDLCEAPLAKAREVFDFAGMDWSTNTEEWLGGIIGYEGDNPDFFSVNRNPHVAANKWRSELSTEQIDMVLNTVRDTPPGALFV